MIVRLVELCSYVKLSFLGHHPDKFIKELSPIFTKFFLSVSFRIIFVNIFKIGSFVSYKYKLSKAIQSSLVKRTCWNMQFSCNLESI